MDDINHCIARRLRKTRKALGLSRRFVAKETGLSFWRLLCVEIGRRPVKSSELAEFCKLYCRDTWYFLREDDPPKDKAVFVWEPKEEVI